VTTNIYGGLDSTSKSFRTHADSQYVLILQLDGVSDWTIFGETWNGNPSEVICTNDSILTVDFEYTLHPGDVLYIPYRRYHKCIPKSKRLSASVSADFNSVRPSNYGDWFSLN
jgi:ribosomal protein L16 Arg81 hydroxylase